MKKFVSFVLLLCCIVLPFVTTGCGKDETTGEAKTKYGNKTPEEIVASLTLEQKASQMVQGASYATGLLAMKKDCYGSLLSDNGHTAQEWRELVLGYQEMALASEAGIPYIYGNDSVHGVNTCSDAVIFPHNINVGAVNNSDLAYKMGVAVANEAKLTGMIWNFSPCVAVSGDPRWGRTYECYSSDVAIVKSMGTSYAKGLMDGGILPCAKHYIADGNTVFGTGEHSLDGSGREMVERLIDRGNAILDQETINQLLDVYKQLVDDGVMSVMISHSSLNGVKMHKNTEYIRILKEDLKFNGIVISDWESIHNIDAKDLKESVKLSINAGIDMLMEPASYRYCRQYIIELVNSKEISEERLNDAVLRIIRTKKAIGLFDDPLMENMQFDVDAIGSKEYRDLAREIAEKSLVLLKNDNSVLPVSKAKKICLLGPAANDTGVLCGGWTLGWEGGTDAGTNGKFIKDGKTILDGFKALNYQIVSDPSAADVVILCLGEKPYAEWTGDESNISITGPLGLNGNSAAIEQAKASGKPVVACIVAGRNVLINDYVDDFDAVVMCYLPGSEGDAVANVLSGDKSFVGTLPMPYYSSIPSDNIKEAVIWHDKGYKYQ